MEVVGFWFDWRSSLFWERKYVVGIVVWNYVLDDEGDYGGGELEGVGVILG